MIFRLRSGSTTRARASRNTSEASSETRGRLSRSANRVRTCSASSSRRRPLSTKMQVRRSPIARWTSSAATVESTPPLTPHTTRPSGPTCSRIRAVASSTNDAIVQSPAHPQMSRAKFRRSAVPCVVCTTSGWNRTPCRERSGSAMTATGAFGLVPRTANPGGGAVTRSPWLAHTCSVSGRPRSRRLSPRVVTVAWPYSRSGAADTTPPSAAAMDCMP